MLKEDDLLTSKDIANMTLKEFLSFKRVKTYRAYRLKELMEANSDWLLIGDLENVTTIKELRKLINDLKEDLWYEIRRNQIKR